MPTLRYLSGLAVGKPGQPVEVSARVGHLYLAHAGNFWIGRWAFVNAPMGTRGRGRRTANAKLASPSRRSRRRRGRQRSFEIGLA